VNDLRQALEWCFGNGCRPDIGFELTVSALPLWDELSIVAEAQTRIDQSLAYAHEDDVSVKSMAKLARARAWHLMYAEQIVPETAQAWKTAIEYAQRSGEVEYELRALWGFAAYLGNTGEPQRALEFFERFRVLATLNKAWTALRDGEWHFASTEIYLSRFTSARSRLERLARPHSPIGHRSYATRFVVDGHIAISTHLSFVLWLTGEPERALQLAEEVSDLPEHVNNIIAHTGHLGWSHLPIAMWNRDVPSLFKLTERFRKLLMIENVPVWQPVLDFYQSVADYQSGDTEAIRSMSEVPDQLIRSNFVVRLPLYLGTLAEVLFEQADYEKAQTTLHQAFSFADRYAESWTNPELLRVSAGISRAQGDLHSAEEKLSDAIRTALDTRAVSFALRAANDLAEIYIANGDGPSARDVLQPVYGCFSEGFDTRDLARASSLLKAAGVSSSQARKSPAIGCESGRH
jgi:tetratricopeptide (TPR) repeat protein